MRKDNDLALQEDAKIRQLESEIEEKNQLLEMYKKKANQIEKKVKNMKKFETFLDRVKDQNQDEFSELADILGRYKQLSVKNNELHKTQDDYITELDKKTKELTQYIKDMETKKITINNNMS